MTDPESQPAFDPHLLQEVITRLAEAWNFEPQAAEIWLARHPNLASHPDAAVEVIYTEFVLRERSGESVGCEEYLERFPQYREPLAQQLELHQLLSGSWLDAIGGPTEISQTRGSLPDQPQSNQPPDSTRFEIVRRLGSGGMGVVYAAIDHLWGQTVALKTVRNDRSYVQHLKQEFRTLADVSHPNIVSLYELFSEPGQTFFTMELLEGVNFLSAVRSPGDPQPNWERLEHLLLQAVQGIAFLHQQGILHCDIKPSNFLVTTSDRCVLLDFGLATEFLSQNPGAEPAGGGTLAYFAPELRTGGQYSVATDWYALGVTLFQAIYGQTPPSGAAMPSLESQPPIAQRLQRWCSGLLDPEIDLRLATAEQLCRELLASPGPPELSGQVFGREGLLEELTEHLQAVQQGEPTMVLLAGDSGVGKTTVLKALLESCPAQTWTLSGRCHPCESVPYKAIDSVMEQLTQYLLGLPNSQLAAYLQPETALLVRMFPCLGSIFEKLGTSPATETLPLETELVKRYLENLLRELLQRLGKQRTVVVAIDDLQWSDEDSLQLLKQLFFVPDPPCLLFVGSYRPTEVLEGSPLQELLSGSTAGYRPIRRVSRAIEPLAWDAMEQLLEFHLPEATPETRQHLIESSCGNPFLLQELCHSYQENRHQESFTEADDLIWKRIEQLEPSARELLALLSLVGKAGSQATMFAAVSTPEAWHSSLHRVRKTGLVRVSGTGTSDYLEISHDRVRETVISKLDDIAQQSHHHRLARAFEEHEPHKVDALAFHYEHAARWPEAAKYAEQAANLAAGQLAFRRAAELYRKVLQWRIEESAQDLRTLREKLGFAEAHAGRGRQAAEQFLRLAEQFPERSLDYRRRAMHQLVAGGNFLEALEAAKQIAAAVGVKIPQSEFVAKAKLLAESLRQSYFPLKPHTKADADLAPESVLKIACLQSLSLSFMAYRPARGVFLGWQFQRAAFRGGTQHQVAHALAQRAGIKAIVGKIDRQATQDLDQAYQLAGRDQDPGTLACIYSWHNFISLVQGRWQQCLELSDKILQLNPSDDQECWFWRTLSRAYRWLPCFFTGRVSEIRGLLWSWLRDAKDRDDAFGRVVLPLDYGAIHWLAADNPDEAEAILAETIGYFPPSSEEVLLVRALIFRLTISLYRGNGRQAWKQLTEFHPRGMPFGAKYNGLMRPLYLQIRGTTALAACFQKRSKLIAEAIAYQRKLTREDYLWNQAQATLLAAGIRLAEQNLEEALRLYALAEQEFTAAQMPLHAMVCQRRRGELLGGDEGRSLVDAANEWMIRAAIEKPAGIARILAPFPEG